MEINGLSELKSNPFSVKTPENLDAYDLVSLFVAYPEYATLQVGGHQFLNGHRGSGKSMMLRMMTPEAQCLSLKVKFSKLPYYGAYLSIKATEINSPEYTRLENEPSGFILSEHVLVTKLLSALFVSIRSNIKASLIDQVSGPKNLIRFADEVLLRRLKYVGWEQEFFTYSSSNSRENSICDELVDIFDCIQAETVRYIKQRSFGKEYWPYSGSLLGYQDVLLPVVKALRVYEILPDKPVFFLLDDADNLSLQQTKVLNTWVSYRSTDMVSLKISTQMDYKTLRTSSGMSIESPHDFTEINFTSVYTGSVKENYPKLVEQIVSRRLSIIGLEKVSPREFFPPDEEQEEKIREIAVEIKEKWTESGKGGYRPGDDAYRHARPEYIRRLSGPSKQGHQYRYAGFEQLVHISSGIVRYFLEPAFRMYADQKKINEDSAVAFISPSIQDDEIRKHSDELLIDRFDQLKGDPCLGEDDSVDAGSLELLRNLIQGLGSLFQAHIMDETYSQRRTFSFSISDLPPKELEILLRMGVKFGYLYEGTKGKKSGMGRERLYVLTRRLSPAFKLDPIGFSGSLSVKSTFLLEIAHNPNRFVNRLRKSGLKSLYHEEKQLSLLEDLHYE